MYDIQINDYISVTDINGNEVLHIELDEDMQSISEKLEDFIGEVNNHNF